MKHRKLRIAWSVVWGLVWIVATLYTAYAFIEHEESTSNTPYIEKYVDGDRYSIAIFLSPIAALASWLPWPRQFSLPTLRIATTLVAVALGLTVYASRQ